MNYIINLDYTVFDVEDKVNELASYLNQMTSKEYKFNNIKDFILRVYMMHRIGFGKSKETFLLTVNTIGVTLLSESFSGTKQQFDNYNKLLTKLTDIKESVKTYSYQKDSLSLVYTISKTKGKCIALGNSSDDLDEEKIFNLIDDLKTNPFDEIYNIDDENKNNVLKLIVKEEKLEPESTALITACKSEALAAANLGMDSYLFNTKTMDNLFNKSVNNFEKFNIKTVNSIQKLNEEIWRV